ncbi:MAG: trigger factor [Gammaproteobacteria bacterium]|nr:trigger factor [Gammaproteobacteria bacterium]
MQVSVEAAQGLERKIKVAVPADKVDVEVERRLKSMAPRVKISGFRPGKVPFSVIQKRYSKQIRLEVLGDVINSSFYEAVAKENLRPAGTPVIEEQNDTDGGIEYTARFEIYPDIEIKGVEKISISRPKADIAEADIDKMVETLRTQRKEWKDAGRAAQKGDRVTCDYKGEIDGVVFEGGEGKDLSVEVGSGSMIAGFEDGLKGGEVGKYVEMDLTFPDPYHKAEIAGKPVHFTCQITKVEEPVLPEVNEEFARSFGIEDGNIATLRDDLRRNMKRELDQAVRGRVKNMVMDQLLEQNSFDVPGSMVDQEAQRLAKQMKDQMSFQGAKGGDLAADLFKEQAKRRVALGLILAEIIQTNQLKAAPEKVRQEVESIASAYGDPQQVVNWYYQDRNRLQEVESMVLEDCVVEWTLERAQVTDNMMTFDEIMKPSAGG